MRTSSRSIRPGAEDGAASVAVVGIVGAVLILVALLVPLLAASVAAQRASAAADAAALAAADASSGAVPVDGTACDIAARAAELGGARLVACTVEDGVARVAVEVPVLGGAVGGTARAGPPS